MTQWKYSRQITSAQRDSWFNNQHKQEARSWLVSHNALRGLANSVIPPTGPKVEVFIKRFFFSSTDMNLDSNMVLGWCDFFPPEFPDQRSRARSDRLGVTSRPNQSIEAKDIVVTSDQSGSGTPRPHTAVQKHTVREKGNELDVGKARTFLITDVTQICFLYIIQFI